MEVSVGDYGIEVFQLDFKELERHDDGWMILVEKGDVVWTIRLRFEMENIYKKSNLKM